MGGIGGTIGLFDDQKRGQEAVNDWGLAARSVGRCLAARSVGWG